MKLLLLPFKLVWTLMTFILSLTGRLITAVLGIVIMAIGILLSMSIVFLPVGIPIGILGLVLLLRSIF